MSGSGPIRRPARPGVPTPPGGARIAVAPHAALRSPPRPLQDGPGRSQEAR